MRVITAIGEQGLTLPTGESVKLRPSFYAMTQLGEPREIVEKFARLYAPPQLVQSMPFDTTGAKMLAQQINSKIVKDYWLDMLFLSWEVLTACSDQDLRPFIGEPGTRYKSYRPGPVSFEAMLVLARSLMRHGIIGPIPEKSQAQLEFEAQQPRDKSKYTDEFHSLGYVSKAVAHLGVSEEEAWNMTLTGFVAHWEAKFGEPKDKRHSEEHDDTMAWLAKVNSKRSAPK